MMMMMMKGLADASDALNGRDNNGHQGVGSPIDGDSAFRRTLSSSCPRSLSRVHSLKKCGLKMTSDDSTQPISLTDYAKWQFSLFSGDR